jgi:hypothetical protein
VPGQGQGRRELGHLFDVLSFRCPIPGVRTGHLTFWQTRTARREACQIDVLVRSKRGVYLFEVKFRDDISRSVVSETQEKVRRLVDKVEPIGSSVSLPLLKPTFVPASSALARPSWGSGSTLPRRWPDCLERSEQHA